MMKTKMDLFEIKLLINGLYKTFDFYLAEEKEDVRVLILRLIDAAEQMKPNRKVKLVFTPPEQRYLVRSLVQWRNQVVAVLGPTEDIDDLLLRFMK